MSLFRSTAAVALALGVTFAMPALAQKKYDTGASDTEIKVGQTIPLSGPASAYGSIGKVQAAYLRMINEQGGINGRKINLIQYDDAYSPPKTVEQVRKLVEGDEVLDHLPDHRHAAECRGPEISERQESAAASGFDRRDALHRSEEFPVDDRVQSQLPVGRAYLREIHSRQPSEREDRHPLSERRPRKGLRQGVGGRAWGEGLDDRGRRRPTNCPIRPSTRRW